jgi:hypothetical protein
MSLRSFLGATGIELPEGELVCIDVAEAIELFSFD